MQRNAYLGGWVHGQSQDSSWQWQCPVGGGTLFLKHSGDHWQCVKEDDIALLLRGVASGQNANPATVASRLLKEYRKTGKLNASPYHGSYTILLLDGRTGHVSLTRNLAGNGYTYYFHTTRGFFFSSNLIDLIDTDAIQLRPNPCSLPSYFLYRFVPGKDTLFEGIYRLLPGEEAAFDGNSVSRRQWQTFTDLVESTPYPSVDDATDAILADYRTIYPQTANLLSGGVDSSYLQAVWNMANGDRPPRSISQSFSVSVNHPCTRADTDYALSAAEALGANHTLVPAEEPYPSYLFDAIQTTGEPPNHVMSVYFGLLARRMVAKGYSTGLCGEAADSLFGLASAEQVQIAERLRRWLPLRFLRQWGETLARWGGRRYLADAFHLSEYLYNFAQPNHPINQVGLFADVPLVQACFTESGIESALSRRRELLSRLKVPCHPLDQMHAMSFLAGAAVDSAALWTTMFNAAGGDLLCPFLDSRMLSFAMSLSRRQRFPYRKPKELLKQALARLTSPKLAYRTKLAFGQPIFEWLSPGGSLRPRVEQIGEYDFLPQAVRSAALARPGWFLYSLLCYDLWHKVFIDRSLPRTSVDLPRRSNQLLAS